MSRFYKPLTVLLIYLLTINLNIYIRYHPAANKEQPSLLLSHLPVACYLGIKNIVADYHWFCLSVSSDLYPDYAFAMADFITDLDPHFTVVYRFVGIYLTTQTNRYDLAIQLLQKGLASPVNSADWRISFYLAYNYHYAANNHGQASFYYAQAAKQSSLITKPPKYLEALANKLKLSSAKKMRANMAEIEQSR